MRTIESPTGRRQVRLWLALVCCAVALLVLFIWVGTADAAPLAGGGPTGYTAEPAEVVAFRVGAFRNVVTVRIYPHTYGTRYTLERWQIGEAVKVTGIAYGNSLGIQFRMWR